MDESSGVDGLEVLTGGTRDTRAVGIVQVAESVNNEEQQTHELLRQIVKKGMELTATPQSDFDPANLKQITGAVGLYWENGGTTSFIVVEDKQGNKASVRMNAGTTARTANLFNNVEVGQDHQELVVDVARERVISGGLFKKSVQFEERLAVGGIPGIGVDPRVSEIVQTVSTNQQEFKAVRDRFGYRSALTSIPPLERNNVVFREAKPEDLQAILVILNTGRIDTKDMSQAIAKETGRGNLLTKEQYTEKFNQSRGGLPDRV